MKGREDEEVKLSTATSLGSLQLQLLIFSLRIIGKMVPDKLKRRLQGLQVLCYKKSCL